MTNIMELFKLLMLILLGLLFQINTTSACICLLIPNFKCPPPPTCCESGYYAMDECGCCLKCAKAELQTCGGASSISGRCAKGLQCLKTCLPCETVGKQGKPCIFPFKYAGETYNKCTDRDSDNGQPWCATQVDSDGYVVDNQWGDCLDGCPGTRIECDDKYFSIQDGKCIDVSVPGAIPNWFGAPAVKLEDQTADIFPAPLCQRRGAAQRFYDNTCRCARGQTSTDYDLRGNPRGNCTGLEDDDQDNLDKVWCFLENIRDPLDPNSGCYSDTQWSERDGRFWSSLACTQAPDIETPVNRRPGEITKPKHFANINEISNIPPERKSHRQQQTRPPRRTTVTTTTTTEETTTEFISEQPRSLSLDDDDDHTFFFSGEEDDDYYYDYEDEEETEVKDTTDKVDRGFSFIVGETNLPGFEKEEEKNPVQGPSLPTPTLLTNPPQTTTEAQIETTTFRRRRRTHRPRLPLNADPRRRSNRVDQTTEFPHFRRRDHTTRRPSRKQDRTTRRPSRKQARTRRPRPSYQTTLLPILDILDNEDSISSYENSIEEFPRSFLEGEFGENNIPLAIPLSENGELLDEIFRKISTTEESQTELSTVVPRHIQFKNFKPTRRNIFEATVTAGNILPISLDYEITTDGEIKEDYEDIVTSNLPEELSSPEVSILNNNEIIDSIEDTTTSQLSESLQSQVDQSTFKNDEAIETLEDNLIDNLSIKVDQSTTQINDDEPETSTIPYLFRNLPILSSGRRVQSKFGVTTLPPITRPSNDPKRDLESVEYTTRTEKNIETTQIPASKLPNTDTSSLLTLEATPTPLPDQLETGLEIVKNRSATIEIKTKLPDIVPESNEILETIIDTIEIMTADKIIEQSLQSPELINKDEEIDIDSSESTTEGILFSTNDDIFLASDTTTTQPLLATEKKHNLAMLQSNDRLKITENVQKSIQANNEAENEIVDIKNEKLKEQLQNVVLSGIVDLGILGLWSNNPATNPPLTRPRPVYKPQIQRVN